MLILGLDSSAVAASCAVTQDETVLAYATVNTKTTHSQTLLPLMTSILSAANLQLSDIDAFAVSHGPGSFTGLRIGVSAVKGLAFGDSGAHKPVCGVSTLLALAHNLRNLGREVIACAVMDARRGEVYNALFRVNTDSVTRLTPDRAIALTDLGEELIAYDNVLLVGDGAVLAYEHFGGKVAIAGELLRLQNAASVCFSANVNEAITAKELMPTYIRRPQAEREYKKTQETQGV
ncbi:MAG: tRNA (adenosine(37)-N6)-threonylcarbamoyltransferase complex dimerization subunit type 1 TsaB [Oscillospiraceae bacterium]|nr:tRNA (adenosine(37)-N6)-threonylcarbamoyltransferase complex dimerization subunit type 1 TsaB [Oscillospiraceae bacterium]